MATLIDPGRTSSTAGRPVGPRADGLTECGDGLFSFHGRAGGIAVSGDDAVWVSETRSATIWYVTGDGTASPLAVAVREDPKEAATRLFAPAGLAVSADGSLFIADSTHDRVCVLSPDGSLRVLAGGANGYRDGPGGEALFRGPLDVAVTDDGICYVADTGNDRIRRISPDGVVTTLAGSIYDYGDGRGIAARFRRPAALDVTADGTCYVADTGNNAIRVIAPDGLVTTLAGWPTGGDSDGVGSSIGLRWPTGIAVGTNGAVWIADHGNGALRCITAGGASETMIRLDGHRWPVAVALRSDGAPVVACAALFDVRSPEACIIALR